MMLSSSPDHDTVEQFSLGLGKTYYIYNNIPQSISEDHIIRRIHEIAIQLCQNVTANSNIKINMTLQLLKQMQSK